MTPEEKANEILERFGNIEIFIPQEPKDIDCKLNDLPSRWWIKQQCALIAVDEILKAYPHTYDKETEYTNDGDEITVIKNVRGNNEFWYQVREEIEKL